MDYIEATQAIPLSDYEDDTDNEQDENGNTGKEKKLRGRLKVLNKPGFEEDGFPVYEGKNLIGRAEGNDICIPLKALSKEHACIEIESGSHVIYDKNSVNKTRRLKLFLKPNVHYELRDGDTLIFGDVKCVYTYAKDKSELEQDAGSETGSESMLEDPTEAKTIVPESDDDAPSSDLIEPSQNTTAKQAPLPMLYATDSEDEDDDKVISQPFATVKETPKSDNNATLAIPESGGEESFIENRTKHGGALTVGDDATLAVGDDTGQTVVAETQQEDTDDEGLAPTQAYTLQTEAEASTSTAKGKITANADAPPDQTMAYTLEPDAVTSSNSTDKKTKATPTETVPYTMDLEKPAVSGAKNKNKQKEISETVAYNMDVEESSEEQDENKNTKEDQEGATQEFVTEAEAKLPNLGASSTLAFDDDFDTDDETDKNKPASRQQTEEFKVRSYDDEDSRDRDNVPTQVFPDEAPGGAEATQVVGVDEDAAETQVLPMDEQPAARKPATSKNTDQTQVLDDELVGDETQVFGAETPPKGAGRQHQQQTEETQVLTDTEIPTLMVKNSPTPRKKVQWDMEATQVIVDEDSDAPESSTSSTGAVQRAKTNAAKMLIKPAAAQAMNDDTQVLDGNSTADDEEEFPVLMLETTPVERKKPVKAPINLEATQVLDDISGDIDQTQVLDDTIATLQVDETPFRKQSNKKGNQTPMNLEATQVVDSDVSGNLEETQVLDETVPTLQIEETPFRKPAKRKELRPSDAYEATQMVTDDDNETQQFEAEQCPTLILDDTPVHKVTRKRQRGAVADAFAATQVVSDGDSTQVFDETCPLLEVDDTPFAKPKRKRPHASDTFVATQMISDDIEAEATQIMDESCPTLDVEDTPFAKPKRRRHQKSDIFAATQVLSNVEATQMLEDDVCPTLDVDEIPFSKEPNQKQKEPGHTFAATQVIPDESDATQIFNEPCPLLEVESSNKGKPRGGGGASPLAATQLITGAETQLLSDTDEDEEEQAVLASFCPTLEIDESPAKRPKHKNATTKASRTSDIPATQVINEEVEGDETDDEVADACPTLSVVSPVKGAKAKTAAAAEATQILPFVGASDDEDNESTEDIDQVPISPVISAVRRNKPGAVPSGGQSDVGVKGNVTKTSQEASEETQPLQDLATEEDDTDAAGPKDAAAFVHPDEVATQAYTLSDNDNDNDPVSKEDDTNANTGPTVAVAFVHPDEAATQAYTLSDNDDGNDSDVSDDIDFGQPMPLLSAQGKPIVQKDEAGAGEADHNEEGNTNGGETNQDDADIEANSEEVGTRPGDEMETQAYAISDEGSETEDGSDKTTNEETTPAGPQKVTEPSSGEDEVLLVEQNPTPSPSRKKRGRPIKAAIAAATAASTEKGNTKATKEKPEKAEKPQASQPSTSTASDATKDASDASGSNDPRNPVDCARRGGRNRRPSWKVAENLKDEEVKDDTNKRDSSVQEEPKEAAGKPKKGRATKSSAAAAAAVKKNEKEKQEESKESETRVEPAPAPRRRGRQGKAHAPAAVKDATKPEATEVDGAEDQEDAALKVKESPAKTTRQKVHNEAIKEKAALSEETTTPTETTKGRAKGGGAKAVAALEDAPEKAVKKEESNEDEKAAPRRSRRSKAPVVVNTETDIDIKSEESSQATLVNDSQATTMDNSQESLRNRSSRASQRQKANVENYKAKTTEASTERDRDQESTSSQSTKPTRGRRGKRTSDASDAQEPPKMDEDQESTSSQSTKPTRGRQGKRTSDASDAQEPPKMEEDQESTSSQSTKPTRGRHSKRTSDAGDAQEPPKMEEDQESTSSQSTKPTRGQRGKRTLEPTKIEEDQESTSSPSTKPSRAQRGKRGSETRDAQEANDSGSKIKEESKVPLESTGTRRSGRRSNADPVAAAAVADVEEKTELKLNTAKITRGTRGRNTKLSIIEEDETGSTASDVSHTDAILSEQSNTKKPSKQHTERRKTVQALPKDTKLEIKQEEPTRQSRRRTIAAELRSETDSVIQEASQGRGRQAGRKQPQAAASSQVKTEERDEEEESTNKEISQKKAPAARHGRGKAAVKVEEVPESSSQSSSRSSRGRGKSPVVASDETTSNTDGDDFASTQAKRTLKRHASMESISSNASTTKKRRGGMKCEAPGSPARSQPSEPVIGSPSLRQRAEKPKILFTGVIDDKGQKARVRIIKELGGEIAENIFDCTHLVTDKVRRTVKFLCGVARGLPIVSINWLDSCRKSKSFVDASEYMVKDPENEKTFGFTLAKSVSTAAATPMLQGYKVHVTRSVKPDPKQMKDIITCAGGEFLSTLPTKKAAGVVVVTCEDDYDVCKKALTADIPTVSAEFILTGILRQLVDLKTHRLFAQDSACGPPETKKRRR